MTTRPRRRPPAVLAALVILAVLCWPAPVPRTQAVYVGGQTNTTISSTTTTLTYAATAGNTLFALVNVNTGTATITIGAAPGWTAIHPTENGSAISIAQAQRAFVKVATGSDSYAFTVGTSGVAWYAIGVIEFSGISTTIRDYKVTSLPNAVVQASGPTATPSVAGDVVVGSLTDGSQTGAQPSLAGFTTLVIPPNGAGITHFGTNFGQMGALGWKVATGATENATWTLGGSNAAIVGTYILSGGGGGGGGGGGCTGSLLLGGAGKCE